MNGLKVEPGGYVPRKRAVQKRLVDRFVQIAPGFDIDAVDEQIGIEGRLADEGQHLAIARVQCDQRATPIAEHFLDHRLQPDIDRHHQRVAWRCRVALQSAHRAPAGAGLDLFKAGGAVQFALVTLLDAEFADVVGAAVIGLVLGFLEILFFGTVDAADIADQVAADLAERVVAEQTSLDLDRRKAEPLRGETCHLLVTELGADRQRLETLAFVDQSLETFAVARLDLDQFSQRVDRRVEIDCLRRRDLQRERRIVVGQHDPVAIDDQTAVRNDRHHRDAVVVGTGRQFLVFINLQKDQSRSQQAETDQDERHRSKQPGAEAAEFEFDIFQFCHNGLFLSGSGVLRCGASSSQVMTGHNKASPNGAASNDQPGHMPPASMRTMNETACASMNSGKTWIICAGTPNHNRRRCMLIAK